MVLPVRCLLSHLILSVGSVSAELPSRRCVNMSNNLGELFKVWIMDLPPDSCIRMPKGGSQDSVRCRFESHPLRDPAAPSLPLGLCSR